MPYVQPYVCNVHVHYKQQILYTIFAQVCTQDLTKASQCLAIKLH